MKNIKTISLKIFALLTLIFTVNSGCERSPSGDVEFATFSQNGLIFTDNFIGLGSNFFFPFVGDGARPDVFSVDNTEGFESEASIRIDVPNADDPLGNFAGASFVVDGSARNLTNFDALTFYAKASQAATIGTFGFGQQFRAAITNVDLTTSWQKYIIPIPDPSKLVEVRSVFEFAAGGIGPVGEEVGYSFWIDELQFEKLGTVAQPRPSILNGEDIVTETFIGLESVLSPFSQTFNLGNGVNQTVEAASAYFTFNSTDPDVARVNESGEVTILRRGTAEITAMLAGVRAQGSLTAEVVGSFNTADIPPARDADDVISIFSGAYTNLPGLNVAAFNSADIEISVPDFGGDEVISYNNLGFVGIGWAETADVSGLEFLHVDIQVPEGFNASGILTVEIVDFGPNDADEGPGSDDSGGGFNISGSELEAGDWVGFDIPVDGFTLPTGAPFPGSPNLNNVSRVVFVGQGISDILVDNIYFYR